MQTLGLHEHPARRWEPKKLRLRLFSIPARMARTARRATLHAAADTPWTSLLTSTIARLDELGGLARPG